MLGIVAAKRAGGHATGSGGATTPPPQPPSDPAFDGFAELPRVTPSYTYNPPLGGVTHTPATAAELRTLLTGGYIDGDPTHTLQKGDIIQLTAGTVYTDATYQQQTFPRTDTMSPRAGASGTTIYVISSALASLPVAGRRVSASDKQYMPIFRQFGSSGTTPLTMASKASGYVFVGIAADDGAVANTSRVWNIGCASLTESDWPTNIVLDRCYAATESGGTAKTRAAYITYCGSGVVIRDSYFKTYPTTNTEQQALSMARACTGGVLIDNCYLEATTENFISGGDGSYATTGPLASDVTIRRCHLYKPAAWRNLGYGVKNLFEMKAGQRFLVEDCFMENFWDGGQQHAVNLKSVNQTGADTLAETRDVTIRYCRFKNIWGWLKVFSIEGGNVQVAASRVTARQNLVEGWQYYGAGTALSLRNPSNDGTNNLTKVTVSHNTVMADGSPTGTMWDPGDAAGAGTEIVVKDNILHRASFGIKGTSLAEGTTSLNACYDSYTVEGNLFIGANSAIYPANNQFPASVAAVGFTDAANRDYSLTTASAYKGDATDLTDPGCNVAQVLSRTSGCVTGVWS